MAESKQWEGSLVMRGGIVVQVNVTAPEGDPRIDKAAAILVHLSEEFANDLVGPAEAKPPADCHHE